MKRQQDREVPVAYLIRCHQATNRRPQNNWIDTLVADILEKSPGIAGMPWSIGVSALARDRPNTVARKDDNKKGAVEQEGWLLNTWIVASFLDTDCHRRSNFWQHRRRGMFTGQCEQSTDTVPAWFTLRAACKVPFEGRLTIDGRYSGSKVLLTYTKLAAAGFVRLDNRIHTQRGQCAPVNRSQPNQLKVTSTRDLVTWWTSSDRFHCEVMGCYLAIRVEFGKWFQCSDFSGFIFPSRYIYSYIWIQCIFNAQRLYE